MDSVETYWRDRALLEWQVELGADEAISETAVDRYALVTVAAAPPPSASTSAKGKDAKPDVPAPVAKPDPVTIAAGLAAGAADIDALKAALAGFDGCAAKRGARAMVFASGTPQARVMIVGEVPDRITDRAGAPFAGADADLLGRMVAAIGLDVDADDAALGVYMTAALPWRTPGDGLPEARDIAMLTPFLHRHITLANPDVVIAMGNTACQMLLGRAGINRMRGTWGEALGRPVMPMLHPQALLKTPMAKREAWADLLAVQAKLRELG